MTATLKEAIAAVRAGDLENAQLLVAEVIQLNPDDPQAWYLMSQLVDSPARRAAYLNKTLELDPSHERALVEFDRLPPELTAQFATDAVHAPAEGASLEVPGVEPAIPPPPEWLRPLGAEPVSPQPAIASSAVPPVQPVKQPAPAGLPQDKPQKGGGRNDTWLIALWVILGLVTLIVLGLLIYLIVR
jgi:hypothetical protein